MPTNRNWRSTWWSKLLGNENGEIISKDEWNEGLFYPKGLALISSDFSSYFNRKITGFNYCPYCLAEGAIIYQKKKWQYPWTTYCDIHFTPLAGRCVYCNNQSFLYGHPFYNAYWWKLPWGHCTECHKPLAVPMPSSPQPQPHNIAKEVLIPNIRKMNEMIELSYSCQESASKINIILNLAFFVKINYYENNNRIKQIFVAHKVDTARYVCSDFLKGNEYYEYYEYYMAMDSAVNLAWEIIENHPEMLKELRDCEKPR